MKFKYMVFLLLTFTAGLAFAQKDPNIYSSNPDTSWTFINASTYPVIILFKNNVGFRLVPNGGQRTFSITWLVDNTENNAEDEQPSVGYVSTIFPSGRKYWSWVRYTIGGETKFVARGTVITFLDNEE
jgi:hypothetical protein